MGTVFTSSDSNEMASAAQLAALRQETFWANRSEVNDAERDFYAVKSGAKVDNLAGMAGQGQFTEKMKKLESENKALKKVTEDLKKLVLKLEGRVEKLKKSKKPALIAKTSVLLACKPWDDETDMNAMLKQVKTIQQDGLVWGASKLVPVGYGVNKLQILAVVEDE